MLLRGLNRRRKPRKGRCGDNCRDKRNNLGRRPHSPRNSRRDSWLLHRLFSPTRKPIRRAGWHFPIRWCEGTKNDRNSMKGSRFLPPDNRFHDRADIRRLSLSNHKPHARSILPIPWNEGKDYGRSCMRRRRAPLPDQRRGIGWRKLDCRWH